MQLARKLEEQRATSAGEARKAAEIALESEELNQHHAEEGALPYLWPSAPAVLVVRPV